MRSDFYVYEWIRLDSNTPFYVGKGTGNRWRSMKGRNPHFINIANHKPCAVVIVAENLTEDAAFEYERKLIDIYRSEYCFDLANYTDGGEGSAGWFDAMPDNKKAALIKEKKEAAMGKNNPFYGRKHSVQTKLLLSNANKGRFAGEKHPLYGKTHTQEARDKISRKAMGRPCKYKGMNRAPEIGRKISRALKGKTVPKDRVKKILETRRIMKEKGLLKKPSTSIAVEKLDENFNLLDVYESINEAAIKNNLSRQVIMDRITNHPFMLYEGFLWRKKDSGSDSLEENSNRIVEKPMLPKKVQQIDLQDNLVAEYNSILQAANKNNINRHGIMERVNGERYSPYEGFYWKSSDVDFKEWKNNRDKFLSKPKTTDPRSIAVIATNNDDGTTIKFNSLKECAKHFKCDKKTIQGRIAGAKGRKYPNYSFSYLEEANE